MSENCNLYARIQQQLQQRADQVLITHSDGRELTGAELIAGANRMANVLTLLGVQPGDRVSVQVEKTLGNVLLYLGVLKAGGVYLPLNTAYTAAEVTYFLTDATPKVHVCSTAKLVQATQSAAAVPGLQVVSLDDAAGSLWTAFAAADDMDHGTIQRAADDLGAILYTSGTTGKPKGAMLSHDNLSSNADMLITAWDYSAADVLLHALPLFHVHGLFVALNLALVTGGKILFLPRYAVNEVMALLPQATVMMGVPTYYTRLLVEDGFQRELVKDMRLCISGSAPLLVETSDAFAARTGLRILERYGMTETGMSCSNPLHGERRAGSVGPALPGVEARVMDAQGQEVPRGEIGTLQVRGRNVFKGYWNLPEKTAEEFTEDGYFITGDLATCSTDGYIAIVGRGKDLIISGGLNIYPKEIEDVLNKLEGVVESAVIGVPHADFGEGVVAILVGEAPLDFAAISQACREQLAAFKLPRRWVQLDELPRNTMGKVQKKALREEYQSAFV